jgi:ribosomal protein S18 acetylase RimI-like enzyme
LPETPPIRPAVPEDADVVARLLYETATGMYDVYTGGRRRALRILRAAYGRPGNSASREIVWVAEVGGAVAGALAAFPVSEGDERASRFLRVTLARTPPWKWPATLRIFHTGADLTPVPPPDSLYVDALATEVGYRRRGVASALLDEACRLAGERGCRAVALDTAATNTAAQALYERCGFAVTERRAARGPIPGIVGYARLLEDDARQRDPA